MALFVVSFEKEPTGQPGFEPGDAFRLDEKTFLVSSDLLTEDVARICGINAPEGEAREIGVVLGLNGAHSGYHRPALWEWLNKTPGGKNE